VVIVTTKKITDDDLAGVRVIVLTTFELDEYVVAAMGAGASGFLDKGVEPEVLLKAVRVVAAGDALLTPQGNPRPAGVAGRRSSRGSS
jgi:DNA-binding NarL/FixJ family response regulator